MAEITQTILTEIGNDLSIDTMNVCVDVQSKGLFKRNKSLHISRNCSLPRIRLTKLREIIQKSVQGIHLKWSKHLGIK